LKVRETGSLFKFRYQEKLRLDPSVFLNLIAADIVNNCNLRCPFCVVDYRTITKTELMSEETFVSLFRLIRSVPEAGFMLSCLHEPTLHPRLNDFIELIPRDCRKQGLVHHQSGAASDGRRLPKDGRIPGCITSTSRSIR
jgi:hypothetical protein